MSAEALLGEATALLGSRLAIKAGDQAYFGGKQVYTNVSTCGKSTGDNTCVPATARDALAEAVTVLKDALGGKASVLLAGTSDKKVFDEIAALKKENASIKEDLAELKRLIQSLTVGEAKRVFEHSRSILILGDGNLSFSLALATLHPEIQVTSTVLESEEEFNERYGCFETVISLRALCNVTLLFSIDATCLTPRWRGLFNTIIMNFPHPGGKTNLRRSRLLMKGVFSSVRDIMVEDTRFHLSLANGQAGFHFEDALISDTPPNHRKDSWQILYIAAEYSLRVTDIKPMLPSQFPGYYSSGYKKTGRGFDNVKSAMRIVLQCFAPHPTSTPAPAAEAAKDDDFDLFGSEDEEEDEEKAKLVEERLKAYHEKKAAKVGPIAKSSIILDVKPWDDETDLGEMEKLVRGIEMDGLVWGGAKLIAIGYGIQKLQIICVIEDLKVSVDDLIEKITGDFESHVQSVDIVAFNKI